MASCSVGWEVEKEQRSWDLPGLSWWREPQPQDMATSFLCRQQWYLKMSFLPLSTLHIDCWGLVVNIIEGTVMSFCAWCKAGPSADVALVCDSPMLLSVPVHPIWTILAICLPNTVSVFWVVCLSGTARRPIRRCALQNAAVLFKKGKRRKTDVPSPL